MAAAASGAASARVRPSPEPLFPSLRCWSPRVRVLPVCVVWYAVARGSLWGIVLLRPDMALHTQMPRPFL